MNTRILLARHGAHDLLGHVLCGRMEAVGINETGRLQALRLAHRVRGQVDAVHAGPLLRARQTAEVIADGCGLSLRINAALDEIDVGAWTGARFDALRDDPAWVRWNTDRLHHSPPQGESMLQAQARLAVWLAQAVTRHPGETIVAVSHADVIKAACCHALGLSVDHHARFEIDPGSLTTLVAGEWGLRLAGMNLIPE